MYCNKFVSQLMLIGIALQVVVQLVQADVSHLEYSITPSSQVAYYHYPVPRTQQQQRHHQQVARQFAAPALEHAAFTQALTSRGYVFGGNTAGTSGSASAPLTSAVPAPSTGRAISSPAGHADANSLNLKLPVPFGVMPLNVAHLPLQAGAPYASVPHTTGLTSYGTSHVQRR